MRTASSDSPFTAERQAALLLLEAYLHTAPAVVPLFMPREKKEKKNPRLFLDWRLLDKIVGTKHPSQSTIACKDRPAAASSSAGRGGLAEDAVGCRASASPAGRSLHVNDARAVRAAPGSGSRSFHGAAMVRSPHTFTYQHFPPILLPVTRCLLTPKGQLL